MFNKWLDLTDPVPVTSPAFSSIIFPFFHPSVPATLTSSSLFLQYTKHAPAPGPLHGLYLLLGALLPEPLCLNAALLVKLSLVTLQNWSHLSPIPVTIYPFHPT